MTPKQREESVPSWGRSASRSGPARAARDVSAQRRRAGGTRTRWPESLSQRMARGSEMAAEPLSGVRPIRRLDETGFATSGTARTPPRSRPRGLQLARGAEDQLRERGAAGCRQGSRLGGRMPLTLDVGRTCWRLHSRAWEACGDVGGVVPKDDGMEGCRRRMMDDGRIVQASDCRVPNRRAEQYHLLGHPHPD